MRSLDAEQCLRHIEIGDPPGARQSAVAHVQLDESASAAITALEAALPKTEFSTSLLDAIREAYQPGAGMADAFGRWLETTLGSRGLVLYDASDPASKPLAADLFARELERAGTTARIVTAAGERLQARGYHAQAIAHDDTVALFSLNGGRNAIKRTNDGFAVGDHLEPSERLIDQARQHPELFSPNVLLRPACARHDISDGLLCRRAERARLSRPVEGRLRGIRRTHAAHPAARDGHGG
jgi:uncharacterized protein YllA (UPF0747 family)